MCLPCIGPLLTVITALASWVNSPDTIEADSHIACRPHAAPTPFPCHAEPLRVYNVSFPFDSHSAAASDSQLPCHAIPMLCCGLEKNGMVGAWHGKCESDTAALCKSNGKVTFYTLSGTARARHGNGMLCVWIGLWWLCYTALRSGFSIHDTNS